MDETTKVIVTTAATITVALITFIGTYWNNRRLTERKESLDRINRQLSELYGPMFGITNATRTIWLKTREKYQLDYEFFGGNRRTSKQFKAWRLWMSTIFMPVNRQLFDLILEKSDLLIESEMLESVQQFCAHIAAYDVVLARWKNRDYSEVKSVIGYPKEFDHYARISFEKLKAEQDRLLGKGGSLFRKTSA
jgi:hypothetical protein